MTKPTPENVPKALDAIADIVLAYRPKPKTKAAKRAQEDGQKACSRDWWSPLFII